MDSTKKKIAALVMLLAATITPLQAYGYDIHNYDMASLFFMATDVVEVQPLTEEQLNKTKDQRDKTIKCKVLRVWKGDLKVDSEIYVSLYWSQAPFIKDPAPPLNVIKTVFFLTKVDYRAYYKPVYNGMKLITKGGGVLGQIQQLCNPGPDWLTYQGPELLKLEEGRDYDAQAFDKDFELAVQRVNDFNEALKSGDAKRIWPFIKNLELNLQRSKDFESGDFKRMQFWDFNRRSWYDQLSLEAAKAFGKVADETDFLELAGNPVVRFVEHSLREGLGTPERMEFLWGLLKREKLAETAEQVLLELIAENSGAGSFSDNPSAERELKQKHFEEEMTARATKLLAEAKSVVRTRGAAEIILRWHPSKRYHGYCLKVPPVPLDDSAMEAIRKAFEAATDGSLRFDLATIYHELGGLPAYEKIIPDGLHVLAGGHALANYPYPSMEMIAIEDAAWQTLKEPPDLTAKALDGENAGKLYVSQCCSTTDKRWREALAKPDFKGNLWCCSAGFAEPLSGGWYEFRLRIEYEKNGEKKTWWSFPVKVKVSEPRP